MTTVGTGNGTIELGLNLLFRKEPSLATPRSLMSLRKKPVARADLEAGGWGGGLEWIVLNAGSFRSCW
jgi:hypothetical protein